MNLAVDSVTKVDGGGKNGYKIALGDVFKVKLTTGIEFDGIVLAYDADPNIVIFEEGKKTRSGDEKNTRMVYASSITELEYLSKVKDPLAGKERWIDLNGFLAKEDLAIRKIAGNVIDVTAETQSIFDAFSKAEMFPVEWDNSDIVVLGVRICSPYHSNCVSGGTKASKNRVTRALLARERKMAEEAIDETLQKCKSRLNHGVDENTESVWFFHLCIALEEPSIILSINHV